ncbi:MAG TPA: pentapeptide repeat-containing protein [Microthrixaceae bacterium]|nr:pentapeptide repeat-containing protein [Microthrixaceae bacterium]
MPWIDGKDQFADLPTVREPTATSVLSGQILPLDGEHRFDDVLLDGDEVSSGEFEELVIDSSIIRNLVLCPDGPVTLDASWCRFESSDLSRAEVHQLRSSRLSDCKLVGTDFSNAALTDVIFERCLISLANFRMARLNRVRFKDCTLKELDAFEMVATDLTFDGSELNQVNVDRLNANRVDLRGARSLGLEGIGRLDGCLVAEHQLTDLIFQLAFAVGLGIETIEIT